MKSRNSFQQGNVYTLSDETGLLYVGSSVNVAQRLKFHGIDATCEIVYTGFNYHAVETFLIRQLQPPLNTYRRNPEWKGNKAIGKFY